MDDKKQPIVIKKVVNSHGHHGGAWKVAYADFVTAMMAFFLLMWLMGSTTPQQRMGISQFLRIW
jgi:chemotaxis protein MotB